MDQMWSIQGPEGHLDLSLDLDPKGLEIRQNCHFNTLRTLWSCIVTGLCPEKDPSRAEQKTRDAR